MLCIQEFNSDLTGMFALNFFNNEVADSVQHIAILFEILSLYLVVYDLKKHRKDRGRNALRMATSGFHSGIKNRTKQFYVGIALACLAILMEGYQLACIYFA